MLNGEGYSQMSELLQLRDKTPAHRDDAAGSF